MNRYKDRLYEEILNKLKAYNEGQIFKSEVDRYSLADIQDARQYGIKQMCEHYDVKSTFPNLPID